MYEQVIEAGVQPLNIDYNPDGAANALRVTYPLSNNQTLTVFCDRSGSLSYEPSDAGHIDEPSDIQPYLDHARALHELYRHHGGELMGTEQQTDVEQGVELSDAFHSSLSQGPEFEAHTPILIGHYRDPVSRRHLPAWLSYEPGEGPEPTTVVGEERDQTIEAMEPIVVGEFQAPIVDGIMAQLLAQDRTVFAYDVIEEDLDTLPRCSGENNIVHMQEHDEFGHDHFIEVVGDYSRDAVPATPDVPHPNPVGVYIRTDQPEVMLQLVDKLRENTPRPSNLLIVAATHVNGRSARLPDLHRLCDGEPHLNPPIMLGPGPVHNAHISDESTRLTFPHNAIREDSITILDPGVELTNPNQPPRIGGTDPR